MSHLFLLFMTYPHPYLSSVAPVPLTMYLFAIPTRSNLSLKGTGATWKAKARRPSLVYPESNEERMDLRNDIDDNLV